MFLSTIFIILLFTILYCILVFFIRIWFSSSLPRFIFFTREVFFFFCNFLITDMFEVFFSCLFFWPLSILSFYFWVYPIIYFSLSHYECNLIFKYFSGCIRNDIFILLTKKCKILDYSNCIYLLWLILLIFILYFNSISLIFLKIQ